MSVITRFRQFRSQPLPQRMAEADTNEYQQPQPRLGPNQFLTYWMGNQLPGQFIHTQNPHEVWIAVKDKKMAQQSAPGAALRRGGSFNYNLSQQTGEQIIASWRDAWRTAAQQQAARR